MSWAKKLLGDFAPFVYGKGLPKEKRIAGNVPVYGSNGVVGFHNQPLLSEPAVIIGRKGSVGEIHLTAGPSWPIDTTFYAESSDKADLNFLFYLLQTLPLKSNSDSAVPGLNRDYAHSLEVFVPEKPMQVCIGSILKSIDLKISSNNAVSKNLEDIAQIVFKSWFIDFDPVKAKMAGEKPVGMDDATAALFPESMEDSEFGPVPTGWSICKLGDICSTAIGGLWGKDDESADSPSPYRCIRGVDMDDLKANGFAPRTPLRWDKAHNHEKRALNGKNILIAGSGAGPVGKSLLWDESMNLLFDGPVIYSNFVKRLECLSRTITSYVSSILSQMYSSGELFIYVNGTSVPNLQDGELLNGKRVVLPSEEILEKFDSLIRLNTIHRFSGINRNLVEIRDSLLPRLISGELQIPEEMLVS